MVADGAALRHCSARGHPGTHPPEEFHYLIWWGATAVAAAFLLLAPATARGEPSSSGAKACRFEVGPQEQQPSACVAQLGDELENVVCSRANLFEVVGDKLRINNSAERIAFRGHVKRLGGNSSGCPKEVTDLVQALNREKPAKGDLEDVQQLIAALFVVRQTADGSFEIVPRPKVEVPSGGKRDSALRSPGASPPAANTGAMQTSTGEATNTPAPPLPTAEGTKANGEEAVRSDERTAEARKNQEPSRMRTPWWLVVGLVWALLVATAVLLTLLLLLRKLRDIRVAMDDRSTAIERTLRKMTIGYEKSILTGYTALVNLLGDVRTSLRNLENRIEKLEVRLDRFERLMMTSARTAAPLRQDPQTRAYECVSDGRMGAEPFSPARAGPPASLPTNPTVDEDLIVDSFNSCLSTCLTSGRRSDASEFVRTFNLKEVSADEEGKIDINRNSTAVAMWYTLAGPDNEYILIPTVRQVYDDLGTLVGNGIEGAQRKLGVYFEVHETEKGTRHAVLERVAIVYRLGPNEIKQKGLLRLPFGQ